ncbi:hypothetical protein LTR85_010949 [Meristemomyces frigidus]|nr:hypothetical protein LTR85_010949 [Meristemomyces frigidus]
MATSAEKRTSFDALGDDSMQPEMKRAKSKYTSTIMVLVGEDEEAFTVHESLICGHADFFKAACSAEWKEGQTRTVRLPPTKPARFQIYLDWLYSQQLLVVMDAVKKALEQDDIPTHKDTQPLLLICELCQLWMLGDYLLDVTFKNKVMDNILAHELPRRRLIMLPTIRTVIDGTPKDCGLQWWMVDHVAPLVEVSQLEEMRAWLPADVVFELLKKMVMVRLSSATARGYLPVAATRDKYHEQA